MNELKIPFDMVMLQDKRSGAEIRAMTEFVFEGEVESGSCNFSSKLVIDLDKQGKIKNTKMHRVRQNADEIQELNISEANGSKVLYCKGSFPTAKKEYEMVLKQRKAYQVPVMYQSILDEFGARNELLQSLLKEAQEADLFTAEKPIDRKEGQFLPVPLFCSDSPSSPVPPHMSQAKQLAELEPFSPVAGKLAKGEENCGSFGISDGISFDTNSTAFKPVSTNHAKDISNISIQKKPLKRQDYEKTQQNVTVFSNYKSDTKETVHISVSSPDTHTNRNVLRHASRKLLLL